MKVALSRRLEMHAEKCRESEKAFEDQSDTDDQDIPLEMLRAQHGNHGEPSKSGRDHRANENQKANDSRHV